MSSKFTLTLTFTLT